jgi:hypothetical protein
LVVRDCHGFGALYVRTGNFPTLLSMATVDEAPPAIPG